MKRRTLVTIGVTAATLGYVELQWLGRTYGATPEERHRALPGDQLCENPHGQTTHAITIDAPPGQVWPWLVQMGWGRAQWYTAQWRRRAHMGDVPAARLAVGVEPLARRGGGDRRRVEEPSPSFE